MDTRIGYETSSKKYHETLERNLQRERAREEESARNAERNQTLRQKKIAEMNETLQREWNIIVRWWEYPFRMPQTPLQFHLAPKDRREAFGLPRDRGWYDAPSSWGMGGMYGGYGGLGGFGGAYGGNNQPKKETTSIYLQPDSESAPYLEELAKVTPKSGKEVYSRYLQLRQEHRLSPRFYVHCADYFANLGEKELAVRILSNLSELGLNQKEVRRACGLYFLHWNLFDLAIAEFRDIDDTHFHAIALALRAQQKRSHEDLQKAIDLYGQCLDVSQMYGYTLSNEMDRHLICLTEANRLITRAQQWKVENLSVPLDAKLVKPFDADIRVVAYAAHDRAKISFAITEPTGEIVRRGKPLSLLGGAISTSESYADYMIRRAGQGKYGITLEHFGDYRDDYYDDDIYLEDEGEDVDTIVERPVNPNLKPGFVYVEVYTHYGRENETRKTFMVELKPKTEIYDLGAVR